MPNISIMTPELVSSVIRPSILEITKQVQEITEISKDTKILFNGGLEASYQKGSTMSDSQNERDRLSIPYSNQLQIEIDNTYNEGMVLSTAVRQAEHLPIFNDPNLGIIIKPIYSVNNFTINFKFRSESETAGLRWRDSIRTHISMMRDVNLHNVDYHYLIPPAYIVILKEIHKLRETTDPYGETFEEYLANYASTKITAISNQSGSQIGLGVAESQIRILGLYDFDIAPEKQERDGEGSAWTTTFGYKVSFSLPIAVNMKYPFMIHNQMLDNEFFEQEPSTDLDKYNKSYTSSMTALQYFESNVELDEILNRNKLIRIPKFDEFVPTSKPFATAPVFTALCSLLEDNRKLVLNLREMGDFEIDPDILDMLEQEYHYLTLPYKSIFHVSLYKWSALTTDKKIKVDKDLNVMSTEDLSLRVNHRVVFSMVTDLTMLDRPALQRLKRFPKAGRKALLAINANTGVLKQISHNCNLLSLVPDLPDVGESLASIYNARIQFNTVQSGYVISSNDEKRLKEYKPRARF